MVYFYKVSVSPAQLEKEIGEKAWEKCARYRMIMGILEGVTVVNYIAYFFFPLDIGLPLTLPWDYWISVLLAVAIAIPGSYLMYRGMKDAGKETIAPQKETTLYGGIYQQLRHPQALGEGFMWFPFALLLNSPFLVLYSFVFPPMMYLFCIFEERDLLIRFGSDYAQYKERVGMLPRRRKD
jgi:protein-S-isoprenylcysteine O-methyltransferase Ste14